MIQKVLSILLILIWGSAIADSDVTKVNNREISIDLTKYNIQSANYTKASMKAFFGRDWNVVDKTDTSVTGKLFYKDGISRAQIDFSKAPIVNIKYIDSDKSTNLGYLYNLKRDMLDKLLTCL